MSAPLPAKHLILGFDGADLDVIAELGPSVLPTLHALMSEGAFARLESVLPPATLPNWTTFLTALDPGHHGVFDFTTREGYEVRFTGGTVREVPTVFARLDALGYRTACVGFPATYPPEPLEHGVFISGWDAPVAFSADDSFVWPPPLHAAIRRRFGTWTFDDVDEFEAERPGWHEALGDALVARIERKVELGRWLLRSGREGEAPGWDVFALYFGESDTVAHHLWAHHDPGSPRHPERVDPRAARGVRRVYEALDRALATLREAAGGEGVELTVVSDHGSGGSSDRVLYLNLALAEAGLLAFRPRRKRDRLAGALKDFALTALPPRVRERAFRLAGARMPSLLESRVRYGAIDFARTRAFSDELNYFPGVWLNVAGRDPQGTIAPGELAQAKAEVRAALMALRDPFDGEPVVERVWAREELFEGPHLGRAPDLLLSLRRVVSADAPQGAGYSYNLMPSGAAPPGTGPWRRLSRDEHLGRKGRSLPGAHRERGLLLMHGPSVAPVGEIEARIIDASATALARIGVATPDQSSGRVLWEVLGDAAPREFAELSHEAEVARARHGDVAAVERRLRALGYID